MKQPHGAAGGARRRAPRLASAMRLLILNLISVGLLAALQSCRVGGRAVAPAGAPSQPPPPQVERKEISWPSDPTEGLADEELRRAWAEFERTQQYRLARPSDRQLAPAARARVNSNNPAQIIPFLRWWGARGLKSAGHKDVLVAIVVAPGRTGPDRYGLVVLAAPASEGGAYRAYWAAREEDMESYLISPASGSIFMECFRRDGGEETKELAWDRRAKGFRLLTLPRTTTSRARPAKGVFPSTSAGASGG